MTTTAMDRSMLIAVFADQEQANQAIDELRHASYSYDQIRLVRGGSSGLMENPKSLFSQTAATTNSPDDWMRIGVPEQDARHYQSELDAGRSIVLIKAVDHPEQALGMMRQSGAYDIVARLNTAQPSPAPAPVNPNARLGTSTPPAAPGTTHPDVPPRT